MKWLEFDKSHFEFVSFFFFSTTKKNKKKTFWYLICLSYSLWLRSVILFPVIKGFLFLWQKGKRLSNSNFSFLTKFPKLTKCAIVLQWTFKNKSPQKSACTELQKKCTILQYTFGLFQNTVFFRLRAPPLISAPPFFRTLNILKRDVYAHNWVISTINFLKKKSFSSKDIFILQIFSQLLNEIIKTMDTSSIINTV